MENKVKSFVDSLLKLHKTLGYKGIIKYALIGLGIYALINF